jgi:polyribonucleotide nucleotidyltransferase
MCRALLKLNAILKIFTPQAQALSLATLGSARRRKVTFTLDHEHATPLYHKLFDGFTEHEIADQESKCEHDYGLQVVPRQ